MTAHLIAKLIRKITTDIKHVKDLKQNLEKPRQVRIIFRLIDYIFYFISQNECQVTLTENQERHAFVYHGKKKRKK